MVFIFPLILIQVDDKVNLKLDIVVMVMIEHNGKMYARVSDILRPFTDFSNIDPKVLANKARIGTSCHQAIADDIEGEFPSPDADAVGYFESFLKWKEAVSFQCCASEMRYFDDEKMITGQIDAIGQLGYGTPYLIDFKTSAQESPITWPMQAHLYYYLIQKCRILQGDVAKKFLFIKLNKHGELPQVFEYKYSQNLSAKCMQAIDSYWEKMKTDKK